MILPHKEIDIFLVRRWFTRISTIGELFFPENPIPVRWITTEAEIKNFMAQVKRECYILEDEARPPEVKIKKHTCIPADDYFMGITESTRFKRLMPIIFNHIDFSIQFDKIRFDGVRVHMGNDHEDTEACQLTGQERILDKVLSSNDAFDPFYEKLFLKIGKTKTLRYRIINLQEV